MDCRGICIFFFLKKKAQEKHVLPCGRDSSKYSPSDSQIGFQHLKICLHFELWRVYYPLQHYVLAKTKQRKKPTPNVLRGLKAALRND